MNTRMNLNSYSPFINSLTASELTDFEHYCFVIYDAFSKHDGDRFLEYYSPLLEMIQEKENSLGLELFPSSEEDDLYTKAIVDLSHLVTKKVQRFTVAHNARFSIKLMEVSFPNLATCNKWLNTHQNVYIEGFRIDQTGEVILKYYHYPYRLSRCYRFDDRFTQRFSKDEMNNEIFIALWKMEHPNAIVDITYQDQDRMVVLYHKSVKGGGRIA